MRHFLSETRPVAGTAVGKTKEFYMSYIPDKEAEFIEWSENLIKGSKEHAVELGLPTDKLSEIETLHIEVKALHEKCRTSSYTKVDMQMKNEKRELLRKKKAEFVLFHLQNNDKMMDALREELRIPIYDKTHPPHPKPDSAPEIDIAVPQPRTLRIKFRHENTVRWGKPEFVHGLECLWLTADIPLAKVRDLLHSAFTTEARWNWSLRG
jgi:hypothetical protein